jgi:hypothetical protein
LGNGIFYSRSREHKQPIKRSGFNKVLYNYQYLFLLLRGSTLFLTSDGCPRGCPRVHSTQSSARVMYWRESKLVSFATTVYTVYNAYIYNV